VEEKVPTVEPAGRIAIDEPSKVKDARVPALSEYAPITPPAE
jgi:hypothetical protein